MEEKEHSILQPKAKPAGKSIYKLMVLGLVSASLVGLVAVIGVLSFGIYWLGWQGPVTRTALEALPYPVASVNDQSILYADYLDDVETLQRFFDNQVAEGAPAEAVPDEAEMKANALERLIFTAVLEQEADLRGLSVGDEEIEAEFATLVQQSGGEEALTAELEALYGWEPDKFKRKVLYPYLLQAKLAESLSEDDALKGESRAKAEKLLGQLKEGLDFGEMARLNSDDPVSAAQDGSLGWFERGIMVPSFEEAAFALEAGEMSELVETQFGFHIILVDEVEEEGGEVVRVNARHILIATKSVEQYIEDKMKEAEVSKYVDV